MSAGYDSSFSLAVAAGVYGQEAKRRQVRFAWVVGLKTNGLVNGGKKKKNCRGELNAVSKANTLANSFYILQRMEMYHVDIVNINLKVH
jgi:hypothetical protein